MPTHAPAPAQTAIDRSETSPRPRSRKSSRWLTRSLGLLCLGGLTTGGVVARDQWRPYAEPWLTQASHWIPAFQNKKDDLSGVVMETVRRGPFQITVTERGTLDSLKNGVLQSKVEGSTTIISIVPEGTPVHEGDLVVELDASALIEKESQQKIAVTQAEAALETAKENVEIQKTQNDSDIAAAELKLKLAELDLDKFLKGDFEQQKGELAAQVTLSEEKVTQADETYKYNERLVKKGYKTQNDLESSRIALQTERINLAIAKSKLDLLEKFNYERTYTELKANAEEYRREIDRVKRKAIGALSQKNAELASRQLTHEVEVNKYERIKEQIELCKIRAPQDGQVIYANSRDGRSSESVLIEEGATVRERQPIIYLPDLSQMKVNARVHESRISLVRPGLTAQVKVDAFPDMPFPAVVDSVASVPSSTGSSFMRDIKEYEAAIRLLEASSESSRLRPGLTAQIEVLVESRQDVLQAPIQAILTIVGKQFAFVLAGEKIERRQVEVGKTNDRMVEILSGLTDGEQVVMNPRTQFEKDIKELEGELIKAQATERAESGKNSKPVPPVVVPPEAAGRPSRGGSSEGSAPATPSTGAAPNPLAMFERMDANHDGKLTSDEWSERFKNRALDLDADKDGAVSLSEFKTGFGTGRPPSGAPAADQTGG